MPALVLKSLVLAAIDVQQNARHRAPRPSLAMAAALTPPGHQPRALQGLLDPVVAQPNPVLSGQLLMEMPHVRVEEPVAMSPNTCSTWPSGTRLPLGEPRRRSISPS